MHFLQKIDRLGASLTFNFDNTSRSYRSQFGGLSTLLIYSSILLYAFQTLFYWVNGGLLSNVTIQTKIWETNYMLQDQLNISPKSSQAMNLSLVNANYPVINDSTVNVQSLEHQYFTIVDASNSIIVNISQDGYHNLQLFQSFMILRCDPSLTYVGKCEDPDVIDQSLASGAFLIQIDYALTYVDPITFLVNSTKVTEYITLEPGQPKFITFMLGYTQYKMLKQAITPQSEEANVWTSLRKEIYSQSNNYIHQFYNISKMPQPSGPIYMVSMFNIEKSFNIIQIEYPSIFTTFGNIGGVAGLIMHLQYIGIWFNMIQSEKIIFKRVVKKLCPKYQDIILQKQFNSIKSVTYNDKPISYSSYQAFEDKMKEKINEQYSLVQLISNQIIMAHFLKKLHPNFDYIDEDFYAILQPDDLLGSVDLREAQDQPAIQIPR